MIDLYETTRTRYARQLFIFQTLFDRIYVNRFCFSFFLCIFFACKEMEAAMEGN